MTANSGLMLFLATFWGLFMAAVKVSNWRAGKLWSDGPSLFPMVPVFAFLAAVIGCLINLAVSPWGSWLIAGLHMGWLAVGLVVIYLHPLRTQTPDADQDGAGDGGRDPGSS